MSVKYKVCPMYWSDCGNVYRLRNECELEKLLNDGWEITRVDTISSLESLPSATNIYILKKDSEGKK